MKKLLMTMAASVAAIGLTYAEGEINDGAEGEATVQPTLFELLNDFGDTDFFDQDLGEVFNPDNEAWGAVIWKTSEKEGIIVTNKTGDVGDSEFHLKLETAKSAPLLRTFAALGEEPEEKPVETNVVVDAMISFTGFEEDPVPTEGEDKILVWMKAVDAEFADNGELMEGTGVTNLMITAGKLGEDSIADRATYIIGNAEVGKEYRVTIKSIGNITGDIIDGGVLGFEVYIDQTQVKLTAANSVFWADCFNATPQDNVFPALVTGTTLKAAGFEGTGTIDDVLVCAADGEMAPDFTKGGGEPGSEVTPNDPEAEFEGKVDTVNSNLAAYLKNPFGEGKDDLFDAYVSMFEAVAVGETGKVKIQLTGTAEGVLKEEVNNLSTNAIKGIARILTELASATGDVVTLNNIAVTPGLWYSVAAGSELDGMVEGTRKLAVSATMTLDVPVVKDDQGKKSTKAFYKVHVNVTDNPPEPVE